MTYRCGIGAGLEALGMEPGPPHIRCDAPGCTRTFEAVATRGGPPAWLRNGTAPKGWRTERDGDKRRDYCPIHSTGCLPSARKGT
jgi:hypothetical protein